MHTANKKREGRYQIDAIDLFDASSNQVDLLIGLIAC
jgi:hypothetical protein